MRFRLALSALLLALLAPCVQAQRLPVAGFASEPEYGSLKLSPDGKSLGFISTMGTGEQALFILDLASGSLSKLGAPSTDNARGVIVITNFTWVNDHRVIIVTNFQDATAGAVDIDGTNWKGLTGVYLPLTQKPVKANEILHVFDDGSDTVLMLQRGEADAQYPCVLEVNADSGESGIVLDDSHGVNGWVTDQDGVVRVGVKFDGADTSVIYREKDGAPWYPLYEFDSRGKGAYPLAIDFDGRTAYVSGLTPTGTWGVYSYDLAAERRGPLIYGDRNYDVINPGDFRSQGALLFSKKKRKLVGLRYTAEIPTTVWFDPDMAKLQATINHVLPGAANTITGWSLDETKFLIRSWSDRHPGIYYLYDQNTAQLRKLFNTAKWVNPRRMARMLPLQYKARDGLLVHGYVTFPLGLPHANLPLVVLPHGGPWVRDIIGYDGLVQFLANRGYAVLQVNYRGSPGYGEAFSEAGRRQVGKGIQNDITDGVEWAIRTGIADPHRVAIAGASYGGYSVEWALANTPDLYRCGVSIAGVSDWYDIIKLSNFREETRAAYRYWQEQIGDPDIDEDTLREISPYYHVDQIRAPLFLAHGDADPVVPISQSRKMAAALKSRGIECETMFAADEGHSLFTFKNRIELFGRIEAFLDKHMQ